MTWTELLLRLASWVIRLRLWEQEQVLQRGQNETRTFPWLSGVGTDVVIDYKLLDRMRIEGGLAAVGGDCPGGGYKRAANNTGQAEVNNIC